MRFLLSFLLLFSLSSCKQEELQVFDELSPEEQDEIRNRGRTLCLKEDTPKFERFKRASFESIMNSDYDRGQGFLFELKEDSNSKDKIEIIVWKRTATEIYFYLSSETTDDYFLRITKAENDQIIDDLLDAHCSRPKIYEMSVGDNGPLNVKNEYWLAKGANKEAYIDNYPMSFESLAIFANFKYSRTREVFDSEDVKVGETVRVKTSLAAKEFELPSLNPHDSSYTQKFCSLNRGTGFRFTRERNQAGFKINLTDATDCPATPPGDWNLAI